MSGECSPLRPTGEVPEAPAEMVVDGSSNSMAAKAEGLTASVDGVDGLPGAGGEEAPSTTTASNPKEMFSVLVTISGQEPGNLVLLL